MPIKSPPEPQVHPGPPGPPEPGHSGPAGPQALKLPTKTGAPTQEDIMSHRVVPSQQVGDSAVEKLTILACMLGVVLGFPLSLLFVYKVVRQYERAIILRNGKVLSNKAFGPGLVFILPCIDNITITELRTVAYAVPPQDALTKDSLTVSVDAVIFYQVFNPVWAVMNIMDYQVAVQFLAATTLRNAIGSKKLTELLANRPGVSCTVYLEMKSSTHEWGVATNKVEIKDIRLPMGLQKMMAAEAESSRLANAKIIVANAEIEATKSLQKATEMLVENPYTMQLRYLQSLHMISSNKTHTIVFPLAEDLMKRIFSR